MVLKEPDAVDKELGEVNKELDVANKELGEVSKELDVVSRELGAVNMDREVDWPLEQVAEQEATNTVVVEGPFGLSITG